MSYLQYLRDELKLQIVKDKKTPGILPLAAAAAEALGIGTFVIKFGQDVEHKIRVCRDVYNDRKFALRE